MKVLYIYADNAREWNCSQHNCVNPANAINKSGVHTAKTISLQDFIKNGEETQKECSEADIIVFERNFFQDSLTMLMFWWVRGKVLAGIWDDAYDRMHKRNPAYSFWEYGEMKFEDQNGVGHSAIMHPKPIVQFKHGLNLLKGAQVVSDALCEDWKPYVDTHKIHNHLVIENYKDVEPLYLHKDIWIGWTGSLSHRDSFESSGLLRAFRKITSRYKNVKILITGDKTIYDNLDIPDTRKAYSSFVPAEQYPSLIKSLDIYTIPLYGEYDKRRSQIKPLECMALKVPFIASNFENYNHLFEYGKFVDNSWQNWTEGISEMIENLDKYKQSANESSYEYALTQDIDLHFQERIDLYQYFIDKPYRYEEK